MYLIGVCLIGLYLIDMHLIGVSHIGVHLTGMHLIGICLMGVYGTGVYLVGVHFNGRASHGSYSAKIPTASSRPSELAPELARPRQAGTRLRDTCYQMHACGVHAYE